MVLLFPEYVLEGWTSTLPEKFSSTEIIALYCDHATHMQFHSEFKTDMDLERLPSGKFDTNYLVCQLAALAMNLLRLITAQMALRSLMTKKRLRGWHFVIKWMPPRPPNWCVFAKS